jgi:RHS repeat-associated protein
MEAEKEAVRALKGSMLRQEVYALDGGQKAEHPYLVTEQNFSLKLVQPHGENPHAVFYTHCRETISLHYERNPGNPRITQNVIIETDAFGNVLHDVSVGYGRRQPAPELAPGDQGRQAQTLFTATENTYTNAIDQEALSAREAAYRAPLLAETRQYELTGLPEPVNGIRYSFNELENATRNAAALPYHETPTPSTLEKRLIQRSQTLYRPDDLGTSADDALRLLPHGELEPLALPGETYQLAMTLDHLNLVFGSRVDDAVRIEGGYVHVDDEGWWTPSGRVFLSPDSTDRAADEQTHAAQNFYLQRRYRDPFGHTTRIDFDGHRLLRERSTDPLNNRVQVRNDYRLLQPTELTDPNGNRSEVAFDVIGMVAGIAVRGKQGEALGDSLAGFAHHLTQAQIDAFFANPRGPVALELLGNATRRFLYDEARFARMGRDHPPFAATIVRETHVSDLPDDEETAVQVSIAYSDGFGRVIQTKVQAERGPVDDGGPDVGPRWVGNGWTVFNNKGRPVRQYEPFFDDMHGFRFGHEVGVSPTMFYDPVGRAVATLHPNRSWEKVIFDPWREESWDVNDTLLLDPAADADVGDFFRRLPNDAYLPTWHQERIGGAMGADEQAAAANTAAHANTASVAHLDALKRTFLSIADNGNGETFATRTEHDVKGQPQIVTDALDRVAMDYGLRINNQRIPGYDMLGNPLFQHHMDAGERRTLMNVSGNPLRRWDARGHTLRSVYDALQRLTELLVADGNGERLVQRTVYGEAQGSSQNHRGQIFRQFDGAGVVTFEAYDFKSNLLRSVRQYTNVYDEVPDWLTNPPLDDDQFTSQTEYDALSRPNTLNLPDGSVVQTRYNDANLLETVEANLRAAGTTTVFVNNVDYDAKAQRRRIEYNSGVVTEYTYDRFTFRLVRLHTTRGSSSLQDLHYVYDPAGNITSIRDDAQQTNYFNNAVVAPRADYVYDALYRLVTATGREHMGQVAQPQTSWNDESRVHLQHPHDGAAMRNYTERYGYDGVGNILHLIHEATNGNWTREYAYNEESPLSSAAVNNRLSQTTVSAITETYTYDDHGNMRSMPHLAQMDWDYADRLREIDRGGGGTAYYQYDSSGQRVRKVIESQNGVRSSERLYVGGFERYREFNGTGSDTVLERETVHIMDDKRRLVQIETRALGNDGSPAQLIRYQFDNHLGSASLELGVTGDIISYEEYYPFGCTAYQAVRSQTDAPKRYRYTGMERDEETGLNYHNARFYIAWLGRWLSTDPSGMVDGPNLYRYSRNNPIRLTDVLGTDPNEYNLGPLQLRNPQLTPTGSARVNLQVNNLFSEDRSITVNSADLEGELRLNSEASLPAFDLNGTATGRLRLDASYRDQELSASLAGRADFDVGPLELQTRFGADGTTQVPSTIPLRADAVDHLRNTALQNLEGSAYAHARLNLGRYTLGTATLRSEIGTGGRGSIDATGRLILPDPTGSGGLTIGRLNGTGEISPEGYNISGDYFAVTPIGAGFGDFSLSSYRGFETTAHYFGLQVGPLALSPDMAEMAQQFATAGGVGDPYATTQVFDPGTSVGYSLINYGESGLRVFSVGFSPRASLLNYSQAQPPLPFPASAASSILEPALYGQERTQSAGVYVGASLRMDF